MGLLAQSWSSLWDSIEHEDLSRGRLLPEVFGHTYNFAKNIHFKIYLKGRGGEREIFHLDSLPKSCNSLGWARAEPGATNSILWVAGLQHLSCHLLLSRRQEVELDPRLSVHME